MTQPEKSFENPILFDDGSEEEALLKSKGVRSTQKTSLPDIEVDKSKLSSGSSASTSLPSIEETDNDAHKEEEPEDDLDLVNQLLEDFGNENIEDNEDIVDDADDDITFEDEEDDDDDGITLEDDDDFDDDEDDDYSDEDTVDIDPEILQLLQEVNLEENNEQEEWVIDNIEENKDDDGNDNDGITFSPLEDEDSSKSPSEDELFEEFATIEADDEDEEEGLDDDIDEDDEPEESSLKKTTGKLKDKIATLKDNIRSEIGDGGKKKERSTDSETESKSPGVISKVHSVFLNMLLKITGLLSKLPVIGKVFEPTEKLMTILGRIAYFVPLILLIVLFFITNTLAINKTEVHDLPDEGQVTVQNAEYDREDHSINAEMVNTGNIIAESRVEFSVQSTQLSFNPLHWFIPQEVTTCSTDWISVDLDDIQDITANCEEKELSGFWFRGSIEVVE